MNAQRLTTWLALKCKEPQFREFLHAPDEKAAVACVRAICGVSSRAEIQSNPDAMKRFEEFIRRPYAEFLQQAANDPNHQEK